jgi:primosomal protein N' (replication factor Y)
VDRRRVVEVAVPLPVDTPLAYQIGDARAVERGMRVLVPCGGRDVTGVVVGVREAAADEAELRPVRRWIDEVPALPGALVDVLQEAAREALCPPGLALAAALPSGASPRPVRRVELTDGGRRALERGEVRGRAADLLRALSERTLAETTLRSRFADLAGALDRFVKVGWIRRVTGGHAPRVREMTRRIYRIADGIDPDAALEACARAPRRRELLERLAREPASLPASPALRALISGGWVTWNEVAVLRGAAHDPLTAAEPRPELTSHQQTAVEALAQAIRSRSGQSYLLYGVTGSGKTEVYMRATEVALEQRRSVIVLVPEISLTHQVVDRFRARFGDRVAVLHSGLSSGERYDQWRRLRSGEVPIAIGARSAVFAPLEDPGLIVIDEEHDPAYKSGDAFRYHAREIAMLRARASGAGLVMGSATPDVETAYRVGQGEIGRLVLPERVADRPLPRVEIIDMEAARRRRGRHSLLSLELRRALNDTLQAGQQSILFLNRRGFASMAYCFACGHSIRCDHCDISLVYHASQGGRRKGDPLEGELRCHYCGHVDTPRLDCPACGSTEGGLLGYGTERLAEDVGAIFPHARVGRLDRDTSARKGAQREILAAFHRGELDVLVGTQMIAKGHDVANVTLVGVVAADLGLHFPDFRSGERTFQLLTQVAGRAGRGDEPGRVVIQTFLPNHYAIACARTHDFPRFYREELKRREPHGYPPFRSLVHALLVGRRDEAVEAAAHELVRLSKELGAEAQGVSLLGPAPAPIARIRDEYRWQLLFLGERSRVRALVHELRVRVRGKLRGASLRVDTSPLQML